MVSGYDPAAFDVVREEYVDRRKEPEREIPQEQARPQREDDRERTRTPSKYRLGPGGELILNPNYPGYVAPIIPALPIPTPQTPEVTEMTPQEAIEIIVNEPAVRMTPELMEVINDPSMMMTRGGELTRRLSTPLSRQFEMQNVLPGKKKRKVSKYQREFGRQLKMLKKKFPRTPITKLMKRAHAATRKALKKK